MKRSPLNGVDTANRNTKFYFNILTGWLFVIIVFLLCHFEKLPSTGTIPSPLIPIGPPSHQGSIFRPAFGVRSTQTLVEIYNTGILIYELIHHV